MDMIRRALCERSNACMFKEDSQLSHFSSRIKAAATVFVIGMLITAVGISQEKQAAKTMPIKLGEKAPDFTLLDSTGKKRSLVEFRGKAHVALVFYPALFRAGG